MHVGSGLALIVMALMALALTILVGALRLLFRLADRGARNAVHSLGAAGRSLFGPGGTPEGISASLLRRHPEFSKGVRAGLSFSWMGCPGRLDFITDLTEIRFRLDERLSARLEVSTPSFITQLAEDDPDAFRVRGNEELYRQLFTDPALGKMLRDWGVSFEWIVRPGEFFLQLRALPRNEEELWRWLKGAYTLLRALPGISGEGNRPVMRVPLTALAGSSCQICGATLGQGAVVYCVRCATPHHEDCWIYAGQCSTFACQERSFAR